MTPTEGQTTTEAKGAPNEAAAMQTGDSVSVCYPAANGVGPISYQAHFVRFVDDEWAVVRSLHTHHEKPVRIAHIARIGAKTP